MKESNIINELKERMSNIEKYIKGNKKSPKENKEDEEVCPECGGDLLFVEEGITYCSKCKKYYEEEEE